MRGVATNRIRCVCVLRISRMNCSSSNKRAECISAWLYAGLLIELSTSMRAGIGQTTSRPIQYVNNVYVYECGAIEHHICELNPANRRFVGTVFSLGVVCSNFFMIDHLLEKFIHCFL